MPKTFSQQTVNGQVYLVKDIKARGSAAAPFDVETDYDVGQYVEYGGDVYEFKQTHPAGSWIWGHVNQVTVSDELTKTNSHLFRVQVDSCGIKKGVPGLNIFDKTGEHTKIVEGYYRDYRTGEHIISEYYEYMCIDVKPGEKYTISSYNVHVCFFDDNLFSSYISGFLSSSENGSTFTIPAGAKGMTISINIATAAEFMVQHGVLLTPFYIPFEYGISGDDIIGGSILRGITGKNLFDKTGTHTPIIENRYRDYRYGTWGTASGFDVVTYNSVEAGEQFVLNGNNVHVCFFADEYATEYISGFLSNAENGYTFTTPSGTKSMCISFSSGYLQTLQIEKGSEATSYEAFKFGIKANDIVGGGLSFHVGESREYTTIQSAVNAASDGDIIYIDPGIYEEAVDMVGKQLHLIGAGPQATIVKYAGDDYYYPPLEASKGMVENMAFITTATEPAAGAISQSYCVHIDYDSEANSALQFINCYFKSPNKHTVGIGLRENFTLNFTNCTFISSAPAVYCHEQQAANKTGQRIELINCAIQNTTALAAILLQETPTNTGNEMTILMQRCIAKANGLSGNSIISAQTYPDHTAPTGSNYLNTNGWYLDSMSAMNNEQILNA